MADDTDMKIDDESTNISISTSTLQCDINENIEIYINFEGDIPDVIAVYEDEEIIEEIYPSELQDFFSHYDLDTQIYTYIPTTPGSHTIYLSDGEINSNSLSFLIISCPYIHFDEFYGVQVDDSNSDDVYIIVNNGNYIDGINEEYPATNQTFQDNLEIYFLSKENIDIFREYIDSDANIEVILNQEPDLIRYIGTLYFPDGELYDCLAKKEFNNLIINNKTVSKIKNNSNNKIIDSILMNGNIIYQRNESNVSEKIDTQFEVSHNELWLQDINGNYLEGKLITYQACDNNTLTTLTKNSSLGGSTFLSPTNTKCVVFEGDEEYNGCSYENSNFKGCDDLKPSPKG